MNESRLYNVLLSPHVSEKSTRAADSFGCHVFRVRRDAAKPEIKEAVETLFDVKVRHVRTAVMKGKQKRFGQIQGRRRDWKKAYVQLEAGYDIDFANG